MKLLFVSLLLLISFHAIGSCQGVLENDPSIYPWGTEVDVAWKDNIVFAYDTSKASSAFEVLVENYGDFECEVLSLLNVNNNTCMLITVDWFPGNDYSGCNLYLQNIATKKVEPVMSALYMIY